MGILDFREGSRADDGRASSPPAGPRSWTAALLACGWPYRRDGTRTARFLVRCVPSLNEHEVSRVERTALPQSREGSRLRGGGARYRRGRKATVLQAWWSLSHPWGSSTLSGAGSVLPGVLEPRDCESDRFQVPSVGGLPACRGRAYAPEALGRAARLLVVHSRRLSLELRDARSRARTSAQFPTDFAAWIADFGSPTATTTRFVSSRRRGHATGARRSSPS
jgi:hypothetical protein